MSFSQDPDGLELCRLGEVPYEQALLWQKQRLEKMMRDPDCPDGALLLTHPPIYTLGQGATWEHLRFNPCRDPVVKVIRVERGGEVTYHGPGQWVLYPLLNLRRHRQDLHWYLRQLEQVGLDVVAALGLEGERIPGLTGVWIQGSKVAAIGIRATRWITYHGLALNVEMDLRGFEKIVPCGIPDRPVGHLRQFGPVSMEKVGDCLEKSLENVLGLRVRRVGIQAWAGIPHVKPFEVRVAPDRNDTPP